MNFLMNCFDGGEIASVPREYLLAIVGAALDDRGQASYSFAKKHSKKLIEIEYNAGDMNITADGKAYEVEEFIDWLKRDFVKDGGKILVEATTLAFPEIFISIYAFIDEQKISIDFLYVEPEKYTQQPSISEADKTIEQIKNRGFDLSEELGDFIGIPMALINLSSASPIDKGLFFLGYEDHRFDRIFREHDDDLPVKKLPVVFGVPPFQAGMELNSFSANINVLSSRNVNDGVYYCAANNPLAAYELLEDQYSGLEAGQRMFVAPLGTKPEAIGIAAFVAEKSFEKSDPFIGVIYDHPRKKQGRSSDVFKWHLYKGMA